MLMNLLALLLAGVALLVIARDLRRPVPGPTRMERTMRVLPFVVLAGLSLFSAVRAPNGRHPWRFDLRPSWDELAGSLGKPQHLRGFAVLLLFAVLAFGAHRLLAAGSVTMLLGVSTELAQATVVGHHARLSDLAPDFVGCLVASVVVAALRGVLAPDARPPAARCRRVAATLAERHARVAFRRR